MLILPKEREKIIGRDGDGAFKGNIQYPLQVFSSRPKSNNRSKLRYKHMAPTQTKGTAMCGYMLLHKLR